MNFLQCCLLVLGCVGIISATQVTKTCKYGDSTCAKQLLGSLLGCSSASFTNKSDSITIPYGTVVPYAVFNTTLVIHSASIKGLSNSSPLKLVIDSARNETLLTVKFNTFNYSGIAEFTFMVDDDFDSQFTSNYEKLNYEVFTTIVFKGTSNIDINNRVSLSTALNTPATVLGDAFKKAIATDPLVGKTIASAKSDNADWVKVLTNVLNKFLVDGFLGGYKC